MTCERPRDYMPLSRFSVSERGLNADGILLSKIIEDESGCLYFCTRNAIDLR